MNISIRQEVSKDHSSVFELIEKAFVNEPFSDHQEQFLVERLRASDAFVPELSLVAELDGIIVGHILLSKIYIENTNKSFPSLALAPVSVLPEYQKKGIGGQLIEAAHQKAKELGYSSVVLLGHDTYYPRFGYKQTREFGIQLPFQIPPQYCMAKELVEGALENASGVVAYPDAFYE